MPSGVAHGGDDGAAVLVGREELEAHRLRARAAGAAETDVPVERSLEAFLEQQPERDVEPGDERHRRRERRVELCLRLARPLPVEVEARRRAGGGERGLRDGAQAEAGRRHQRLLRARDDDVETPRVRLAAHGAEARHGVDDDERAGFSRDGGEAPGRR